MAKVRTKTTDILNLESKTKMSTMVDVNKDVTKMVISLHVTEW